MNCTCLTSQEVCEHCLIHLHVCGCLRYEGILVVGTPLLIKTAWDHH